MRSANVLSVEIAAATGEDFRIAVADMLRRADAPGEPSQPQQMLGPQAVAKVNAEFLLRSLADQDFSDYLKSTSMNIADGIGVLWAARYLTLKTTKLAVLRQLQVVWQAMYSLSSLVFYPAFCRTPIPERIPGVDALMLMLEAAQETGSGVYFLGASADINEKARADIQERMPRLKIVGGQGGYTEDWPSVLRDVEESGATLLIVALGCPKQEFWIRDHAVDLPQVRVAVGEGGSLDFIAGDFRRAPAWLQTLGLEWFWRLFMNPNKTGSISRARRIWNAVPVFVYRTVRWKVKHGWQTVNDERVGQIS